LRRCGAAENGPVRAEDQRVAVGRGLAYFHRGDGAVGAGLVLHHHRLAENLAERLRDDAHDDVGRRSGAERHHDADRLGRELCCRRSGGQHEGKAKNAQHRGS
jgi:hypothetical protein